MDPTVTSVAGINAAFARFNRASQTLVEAVDGASNEDPAQAMVGQSETKAQVAASVDVVRIADEMFRELLNISREG